MMERIKMTGDQEGIQVLDIGIRTKLKGYKIAIGVLIVVLIGLLIGIIVQAATKDATSVQQCDISSFDDSRIQDVIIVGGGPAGTFVGYRLKTEIPRENYTVLLLEATNRIGGRLYSERLPGIDFAVAELGGMRYIERDPQKPNDMVQPFVKQVIEEFNISNVPFRMSEDNDDRPYLFRDVFVQQRNLATAGKAAYKLNKDEEDKTFEDIAKKVFEANVPRDQRDLDPDKIMTVHGHPLLHYGTLNIYNLANASDDAHNYVIAGEGYSEMYKNYNSATSLKDTSSTSGGFEYRTPTDGMQTIPKQLAKHFEKRGGRIKKNTTVTALDECRFSDKRKVYRVTTYNYETLQSVMQHFLLIDSDSIFILSALAVSFEVEEEHFARKVVLAVTRSQLKRIHWDALWTSEKRGLVDAVINFQASKTFLAFEKPWWQEESLKYLNLSYGRTISSLPTRQTFYHTAEQSRSFVMIYNDGQFAKFWQALASDSFTKFKTSSSAIFPMTDTLVKEAVRQLALNHNTTEHVIGMPYFGWIMVWDNELQPRSVKGYGPYMPSEAWGLWAPGYNYTEATESIIKLDDNQDIFICGSMYSIQQAWTEGALRHADLMLRKHFNISSYLSPSQMEDMKKSFYAKRRAPSFP